MRHYTATSLHQRFAVFAITTQEIQALIVLQNSISNQIA